MLLVINITLLNILVAQIECSTPEIEPNNDIIEFSNSCSSLVNKDLAESVPLIKIKIAIHFVAAGHGNFYKGAINDWNDLNGTTQAINLIDHANYRLSNLTDNPIQLINFNGDSRIRLEVVPNYEQGVYFWDNLSEYVPVPGVLNALFIDEFSPPNGFSLRGLACSLGNDCDNVKQWGWQSSIANDGPWKFWNFARLLNHEIFHVLGLNHSWLSWAECSNVDIDRVAEWNGGDRWNSGSKNTMNYVSCQCALSPCQWTRIYSNCYNNRFSFTEIDCNFSPIDITIDDDNTWDERVLVTGNIHIKEGATLTIKCEVELNEDSFIYVHPNSKLIIDGGRLTNLKSCNVERWREIKVYGGNNDFDVKFTNDAIIENTSGPAVSMFAPEPWPQITNWGNGILHADNTTFNNTRRIVEFMSWSPLLNPSYIKNCVQNGGIWSITNWNCQGIEVKDNIFNDITDACIVTDHGSFKIVGNEFNSLQNDILFNNVSVGVSSKIEFNQFNSSMTGYNARGTTFAQNQILNNSFYSSLIGVFNDGHNDYLLIDNFINSPYGSVSIENGGGSITVQGNNFMNNTVGTIVLGNNNAYNFFENCYSSTVFDNYIQGRIASVVQGGLMGTPAHNCFSHQGSPTSNIQDIGGFPDPFSYIEPINNPLTCENALLAHQNVNRENRGESNIPECRSSWDIEETGNSNTCNIDKESMGSLLNSYNWLLTKTNQLKDNGSIEEIEYYNRCFRVARGALFEAYIMNGNFNDARNLFTKEVHDDAKVYIYSTYIMQYDLNAARNFLNSLVIDTEKMQDFKTIQNINLDRLPFGPFYEPSSIELTTVKDIAMKSHSYATYAKALYYVLTNEVLSSEIPTFELNVLPRANNEDDISYYKELKVFPNPFSNTININNYGYDELSISITDFFGRVVYKKDVKQPSHSINSNNWIPGIYFVRIKSNQKLIMTEKLIMVD